jgi:hypothetical protein
VPEVAVTTSARFGPHEVTGVVLLHRVWLPSAVPVATWMCAPVPMSTEEVAAVLYEVFDERQTQADDPGEARRWVAEMVLNSGCTAIEGRLPSRERRTPVRRPRPHALGRLRPAGPPRRHRATRFVTSSVTSATVSRTRHEMCHNVSQN